MHMISRSDMPWGSGRASLRALQRSIMGKARSCILNNACAPLRFRVDVHVSALSLTGRRSRIRSRSECHTRISVPAVIRITPEPIFLNWTPGRSRNISGPASRTRSGSSRARRETFPLWRPFCPVIIGAVRPRGRRTLGGSEWNARSRSSSLSAPVASSWRERGTHTSGTALGVRLPFRALGVDLLVGYALIPWLDLSAFSIELVRP